MFSGPPIRVRNPGEILIDWDSGGASEGIDETTSRLTRGETVSSRNRGKFLIERIAIEYEYVLTWVLNWSSNKILRQLQIESGWKVTSVSMC